MFQDIWRHFVQFGVSTCSASPVLPQSKRGRVRYTTDNWRGRGAGWLFVGCSQPLTRPEIVSGVRNATVQLQLHFDRMDRNLPYFDGVMGSFRWREWKGWAFFFFFRYILDRCWRSEIDFRSILGANNILLPVIFQGAMADVYGRYSIHKV